MSKSPFIAFACILLLLGSARGAGAANYACPAPNMINCVPVKKTIGPWKDNGGMMTGNTFAPNNTCANVINLPNGMIRLLCCYTHCGVFLRDVRAKECKKTSESEFTCE
jgi:hypothetical protein